MNGKENPRRTPSTFSGALFIMVMILSVIFYPSEAMAEAEGSCVDDPKKGPLSCYNDEQIKKLRAGEPVYEYREISGEAGYGQTSIIINVPIDRCFEILSNVENQVHYVPGKNKSKIVSRTDGKLLLENEYHFYVKTIKYHSIYTIDKQKYRLGFIVDQSRPHDINALSGFHRLQKIDEKSTLYTYAVTKVDVGFSVPGFAKNYLLGKDLPAMAINVKKYIESNGKWRRED